MDWAAAGRDSPPREAPAAEPFAVRDAHAMGGRGRTGRGEAFPRHPPGQWPPPGHRTCFRDGGRAGQPPARRDIVHPVPGPNERRRHARHDRLSRPGAPGGCGRSASEWQACAFSDEADQPFGAVTPPTTPVVHTGAERVWSSDYWATTDGSMAPASTHDLTVTPSGHVDIWSTVPARPLVCPEA